MCEWTTRYDNMWSKVEHVGMSNKTKDSSIEFAWNMLGNWLMMLPNSVHQSQTLISWLGSCKCWRKKRKRKKIFFFFLSNKIFLIRLFVQPTVFDCDQQTMLCIQIASQNNIRRYMKAFAKDSKVSHWQFKKTSLHAGSIDVLVQEVQMTARACSPYVGSWFPMLFLVCSSYFLIFNFIFFTCCTRATSPWRRMISEAYPCPFLQLCIRKAKQIGNQEYRQLFWILNRIKIACSCIAFD